MVNHNGFNEKYSSWDFNLHGFVIFCCICIQFPPEKHISYCKQVCLFWGRFFNLLNVYAMATFAVKLVCPRARQIIPPTRINPFAINFFEGFRDTFTFFPPCSSSGWCWAMTSTLLAESNESGTYIHINIIYSDP